MKNNLSNLGEGRWRLRVFVGRDDGGRIKLLSRNQARGPTALAKLVADIERGQVSTSHARSLGELLERWLEVPVTDRSGFTLREYTPDR